MLVVLWFWTPCEHQPSCSTPRASPVVLQPPVPWTRAWTLVLPGSHHIDILCIPSLPQSSDLVGRRPTPLAMDLAMDHCCPKAVTLSADVPLRSDIVGRRPSPLAMDHCNALVPRPSDWLGLARVEADSADRSGKGLRRPRAGGPRRHRHDVEKAGMALRRALRQTFPARLSPCRTPRAVQAAIPNCVHRAGPFGRETRPTTNPSADGRKPAPLSRKHAHPQLSARR